MESVTTEAIIEAGLFVLVGLSIAEVAVEIIRRDLLATGEIFTTSPLAVLVLSIRGRLFKSDSKRETVGQDDLPRSSPVSSDVDSRAQKTVVEEGAGEGRALVQETGEGVSAAIKIVFRFLFAIFQAAWGCVSGRLFTNADAAAQNDIRASEISTS